MDEPTIGEIIRDIQSDVRLLVEANAKTVSREVYDLHREAQARTDAEQERRLTALENGKQELKRWLATAVLAPIIVGVILWFVIGGKP